MVSAQSIGGAVRRLMASTDWSWRHDDFTDEAEAQAADILRRDSAKAQAWLLRVSSLAGMPLPTGNGTNGPWNRIACITDAGTLGIVDIAAGLAVAYDAAVPHYVRRFSLPVVVARSPHDGGGKGGIPATWRQVALMLTDDGRRVVVPPRVAPVVTIYGLATCYGGIGSPIQEDEWRTEWAALAGVESHETTDPQREGIDFRRGVNPAMWDAFMSALPYSAKYEELAGVQVTHSGGNWGGLDYVYVTGRRKDRERAIVWLRGQWAEYVQIRAVKAIRDLYSATGLACPVTIDVPSEARVVHQ